MNRLLVYSLSVILLAAIASAPLFAGGYVVHVIIMTFFAVMLGLSYRLLMLGGQASFCHGAFYGIGAYAAAILALRFNVDIWLVWVVSGIAAGLAALLLGIASLRTKGPYFFLMTFGFLMVFDATVSNLPGLTGAFSGLAGIPAPFGISSQAGFYFAVLGICVAVIMLFAAIDRTIFGLEIRALGQSDLLAESIGIPRSRHLIMAFVIGAIVAGIAGAFFGSYITFISPKSFDLFVSVNALTYNIVGGFTSLLGPISGAAYITLVPLLFDWSSELVQIFVSGSIIAIMMFFPRGIEGLLSAATLSRIGQSDKPFMVSSHSTQQSPLPVRQGRNGNAVLEISDLHFGFGGVRIADGVNLRINEGEIVGLIGPNGAGKSTLFNLISGLLRPEKGTVVLKGENLVGSSSATIAGKGLVRTFQSTTVFDDLTVYENVLCSALRSEARAAPLSQWRARTSFHNSYSWAVECLKFVRLDHMAERRAGDLPYGAKKMLGLAVAIAARPTVLCLDEPVTGLTGSEVQEFIDAIQRLRSAHRISLLLVEHRMPVVAQLCDRVYALYGGQICAEGRPNEVTENETVRRIYLGEERNYRRA